MVPALNYMRTWHTGLVIMWTITSQKNSLSSYKIRVSCKVFPIINQLVLLAFIIWCSCIKCMFCVGIKYKWILLQKVNWFYLSNWCCPAVNSIPYFLLYVDLWEKVRYKTPLTFTGHREPPFPQGQFFVRWWPSPLYCSLTFLNTLSGNQAAGSNGASLLHHMNSEPMRSPVWKPEL